MRTDAPIFAAEDLIEENAIEFEHEVDDTEEIVERFRDFLDQVTPDDFRAELADDETGGEADEEDEDDDELEGELDDDTD